MLENIKETFLPKTYFSISILGRNYKLNIKYEKIKDIVIEKLENEINIELPKEYKKENNMEIINICIQKIYDEVARVELEYAMEFARHIYNFAPEDYEIKRLKNSYFKYTNGILILNPDIVEYNKEIIYSSIIKAFCSIKHRKGSKNYQSALEKGIKEYEAF